MVLSLALLASECTRTRGCHGHDAVHCNNGSNKSVVDRVEDLDVWQDRLGIFMLTRDAGTFFLNSYIGDAENTSLVDAATPLGATAIVAPGSAGYLLWECCILASL